ncbi:hypothetical protein AB6E04_00960 [Vibrio amylolyticus]|uniref:hypothetical protein n=1 Tax=Vibrio amylolyticus TaxID=2847292 RepID=UPI003551E517
MLKKNQSNWHTVISSAEELECHFLDVGKYIETCKEEGVHWPIDQHAKFAQTLSIIIPTLNTRIT